MKQEKDYRIGQKVVATIEIEDKGQDFTEIDVLQNGVILGNNLMFLRGRISLLGVGTLDGKKYFTFTDMKNSSYKQSFKGLLIYLKNTKEKDPLPWKASILNYRIIGMKKPTKPNRFIK